MSNIMVLYFTNNANILKSKTEQGLNYILLNFIVFTEMSLRCRVRDFIIGEYKDF